MEKFTISGKAVEKELSNRKTPWRSLYLSYLTQTFAGIQTSVYITSMWPYYMTLDPGADFKFFGWMFATYSGGQMLASWLFGLWNQKTMSTTQPACCGLLLMAVGNLVYFMLPAMKGYATWLMLLSRFLVGFGSGNVALLRGYCAMASTLEDRTRAMALATGSFVVGIALGPAIQSSMTPIGLEGFHIKSFLFNMYTVPALLMVVVAVAGIGVLLVFFTEDYVGVVTHMQNDPFTVVPKFDKLPVIICMYFWFVVNSVATSIELLATPLTIALYNWTSEQAVMYTGIMNFISCAIDVFNYGVLSFTRVGKLDKRKLLMFGIFTFAGYFVFTLPWPFYGGKLDYIQTASNSTKEDASHSGGCFRRFTWCESTTRIPLPVYLFSFIVFFGFGFPYMVAPLGTLFSEILGPRKQGIMQGLFEVIGCLARGFGPMILTSLYEASGYLWPTVVHLTMLLIAL
ncbi:hypothetical protein AB6A40_003956, partial [Gnathostoma spinigerum]